MLDRPDPSFLIEGAAAPDQRKTRGAQHPHISLYIIKAERQERAKFVAGLMFKLKVIFLQTRLLCQNNFGNQTHGNEWVVRRAAKKLTARPLL